MAYLSLVESRNDPAGRKVSHANDSDVIYCVALVSQHASDV